MAADFGEAQRREWAALYDRLRQVLPQFGEEDDHPGDKDYWLVDENLGIHQHRIETEKLGLVQPVAVKSLQKLLIGYPNWEIVIVLGSPGIVVIRDDEIIDGLQRHNLPQEFQTIEYEGSRPIGSRFSDVIYSGSGRF